MWWVWFCFILVLMLVFLSLFSLYYDRYHALKSELDPTGV